MKRLEPIPAEVRREMERTSGRSQLEFSDAVFSNPNTRKELGLVIRIAGNWYLYTYNPRSKMLESAVCYSLTEEEAKHLKPYSSPTPTE